MSRQPPETAVQFGRVNRVKLAREVVDVAINRVAIKARRAIGTGPRIGEVLGYDDEVPGYVDIDNEEQRKLK